MAGTAKFVVTGGADVVRTLVKTDAAYGEGLADVVRASAEELRRLIQANASTGFHAPGLPHIVGTGPGPNQATGDYVNSWKIQYSALKAFGGFQVRAAVYTEAPQGRRLEYGFVGADSLGRVYNQPPYPHVGPAVEAIEPKLQADIEAMLTRVSAGLL